MLSITIRDETYQLTQPTRISRKIGIKDNNTPQAFGLPKISQNPVSLGDFIGDMDQGGSCNVRQLNFCPHNLTHAETPNHVIAQGRDLSSMPVDLFSGLACVIDLSEGKFLDNFIHPNHLKEIEAYSDVSILIVKTPASNLAEDFDFTNTDPLSFHPETTSWLSEIYPSVKLLVCDLPSVDSETDPDLQAHKNYFDIQTNPHGLPKGIVELAYLPQDIKTGYYYLYSTVPNIDTDAFLIELVLYHLKE